MYPPKGKYGRPIQELIRVFLFPFKYDSIFLNKKSGWQPKLIIHKKSGQYKNNSWPLAFECVLSGDSWMYPYTRNPYKPCGYTIRGTTPNYLLIFRKCFEDYWFLFDFVLVTVSLVGQIMTSFTTSTGFIQQAATGWKSPKFGALREFQKLAPKTSKTRWWFQTFFIFTPTWGNDPIWLIFFRWVETTN